MAILIVIISCIIGAFAAHVDKIVVTKTSIDGDPKAITVFATLISGFAFSIFFLLINKFQVNIEFKYILNILLSTLFYFFGLLTYYKSINSLSVTKVSIIFQSLPVFGFIIGFIFLKENVSFEQIFGIILILTSVFLVTTEKKSILDKILDRNQKSNFLELFIAFLSVLFYTLYYTFMKRSSTHIDITVVYFWFQLFLFLFGTCLLSLPSYRKDFSTLFKRGNSKFIKIIGLNEILYLSSLFLLNYGLSKISIVIGLSITSIQPLFVFMISLITTYVLQNKQKEDFSSSYIFKKIVAILISSFGIIIMS